MWPFTESYHCRCFIYHQDREWHRWQPAENDRDLDVNGPALPLRYWQRQTSPGCLHLRQRVQHQDPQLWICGCGLNSNVSKTSTPGTKSFVHLFYLDWTMAMSTHGSKWNTPSTLSKLGGFTSQARKTMLTPFSSTCNSTCYLLSRVHFKVLRYIFKCSKFCSSFSSVLLTLQQYIYHLLWNSINQCQGNCYPTSLKVPKIYPRTFISAAAIHLHLGIVCQLQCACLSPYLSLRMG